MQNDQLSMFSATYHGPALVKGTDDEWIVMCPGCSDTWGEVVNRCDQLDDFPPRVLVDVMYKNTLKRIKSRHRPDENLVRLSARPTDTQRKAAERKRPRSGTQQALILDLITVYGGLTDEQIEELTGHSHQSASAARNALMNKGWVLDSGQRRKNRNGNEAIIWIANTERGE